MEPATPDLAAALDLLTNAVAACSGDFRRGADAVTEAICDLIGAPPAAEDGDPRARAYVDPRNRTIDLGAAELQSLARALSVEIPARWLAERARRLREIALRGDMPAAARANLLAQALALEHASGDLGRVSP